MTCGKIDLRCARCRLSKSRSRVVPGIGPCDSDIVFIGEAPGKDEDARGEPFVGRAGKIFDVALKRAGSGRDKVFITNLVKCRPPGNRRPRKDEIKTCSTFLESELSTVSPKVICVLGRTAAESVLRSRGSMSGLVGRSEVVELEGREVMVFVTYHPAACLYQRKNTRRFEEGVIASIEAARAR